ncbi:MAG: twin-arginine translocation signal domain-containing protein, partial [Planctomycetaceae bacterium]|nr:twin-arginine translocation signal domain-containing protein [Planctomycetaceae bacterium]
MPSQKQTTSSNPSRRQFLTTGLTAAGAIATPGLVRAALLNVDKAAAQATAPPESAVKDLYASLT